MNIKVLLLPDGDDPDSFSRKHSATELKEYIDENQTDFITFKTRITVENVTDPVKRSEGIGGIVKSISVIPDQILRSTYLSELSQKMGIKEQTLLNSMNDMIRKDIEDKEKERARAAGSASSAAEDSQRTVPNEFIGLHTVDEQTREVERLLAQVIVRHGEKVIYDNIETEDGEKISLTVAQYINYDLSQDNLKFHDELYNQILAEAVEHCGDPDFKAEPYFMQHPNVEISQLATKLAIDRHQLGKGFQLKDREGGLRQHVLHLVLDLRMDIIDKRVKEIQAEIRQVGSDMERAKALMEEFKDMQELRNALAKQLGNDVVV
jgi:DNA primase